MHVGQKISCRKKKYIIQLLFLKKYQIYLVTWKMIPCGQKKDNLVTVLKDNQMSKDPIWET
jgi:hypothetical protein